MDPNVYYWYNMRQLPPHSQFSQQQIHWDHPRLHQQRRPDPNPQILRQQLPNWSTLRPSSPQRLHQHLLFEQLRPDRPNICLLEPHDIPFSTWTSLIHGRQYFQRLDSFSSALFYWLLSNQHYATIRVLINWTQGRRHFQTTSRHAKVLQ